MSRLCSVPGCDNDHHSGGYCRKHYMQMYQFGVIKERTLKDPNTFIIEGSICKIGCFDKQGNLKGYAIIDVDDIEKCKPYKWGFDTRGYVCNCKSGIKMHQLISGIKEPDHINRNPADNRKENLRPATHAENMRNLGTGKKNKSGYKGIYITNGKFISQIKMNGKNYRSKSFGNLKEAIIAYNNMAKVLHGDFAVIHPIGELL